MIIRLFTKTNIFFVKKKKHILSANFMKHGLCWKERRELIAFSQQGPSRSSSFY